jgi:hypothetical protein
MQGDIKLPKPPQAKSAPKPKPPKLPANPQPDFVIDENAEQSVPKSRRLIAPPHHHFIHFWRWWLKLGRNQRFAIIAFILLLFGAAAVGWFYFIQPDSGSKIFSYSSHNKPKPPVVVSSLTGLPIDPALSKRPVTGIRPSRCRRRL